MNINDEKGDTLMLKLCDRFSARKRTGIFQHLYIYYACLSVYLFPIKVKTAEPIGPKFCVGPCVTPGKIYGCSDLQKVESKSFWFLWNFKYARKKIFENPWTFLVVLYCTVQREDPLHRPQWRAASTALDPILCQLGFNFDGAGVLQYPAYHRPNWPSPLA